MAITHVQNIALHSLSHFGGVAKWSLSHLNGVSVGFSDHFNDNTLDTANWDATTPGAPFTYDALVTVSETSNQLQIAPRASFASAAYNGYTSDNTYNLTDRYAQVEVVQALNNNLGADQRFVLYLDSSNYIHIGLAQGGGVLQVTMRVRTAGVNSETTVAYNTTNHRFFRLRQSSSASELYFETALAGAGAWTIQRTVTTPSFAITALKVGIVAGTFASIASPGTAIFDNFTSNL